MKNILCPLAALLAASALSSCAFVKYDSKGDEERVQIEDSGELSEKEYEVEDFTAIRCNIPADIVFTQGEPSVKVIAKSGTLDKISVQSTADDMGGLLTISNAGKYSFKNVRKLEIRVSTRQLSKVELNGAQSFTSKSEISTGDFDLQSSGAAEIELDGMSAADVRLLINGAGDIDIDNLDCKSLDIQIIGAGSCDVSGKAKDAKVLISGAGDIDLSGLKAESFDSDIKGMGSIKKPVLK
ncbi:MAG: DUF2807 domain-containing protein [Bacteroides sp.]|nr:DUF2807 domain-containing protein [Bacteroides sp.]